MSKRLRQVLSPTRFSAAEAVLGLVSLVLVVWLLWPESQSPKLDQRAAWQQQLEEAGRQRTKNLEALRPVLEAEIAAERRVSADPVPAQDDREFRTLAKPSELADRLDDRRKTEPIAMPVARHETFETARSKLAKEQAERTESAAAQASSFPQSPLTTNPDETSEPEATGPETLTAKLDDQAAPDGSIDQAPGSPVVLPTPDIKVAVFSSEALDLQSGLEGTPEDGDTAPAATLPDEGSFKIESSSSTHVRQRPRDNAPSWLRHAVTTRLADERPVIAIVIDDMGLNRSNTRAFNDLPAPLTLSFLPYAGKIEAQTDAARKAGHELMVHLPMEPLGSAWPGPEALITSLSHDEFVERLETNLDRIKDYVGVNNHMGSRLTADRGRMDLVMRELRKRDVLFLDSKTNSSSVASEMASRNGVPNTTRDVFLDHVIDIDKIRDQMDLIERIAHRTGSAVAIGHPHTATIEALKDWLPTLTERGFALAPLSAVIARRACNDELLIAPETCGRYLQAQTPGAPSITAGGG